MTLNIFYILPGSPDYYGIHSQIVPDNKPITIGHPDGAYDFKIGHYSLCTRQFAEQNLRSSTPKAREISVLHVGIYLAPILTANVFEGGDVAWLVSISGKVTSVSVPPQS